MPPTDILTRASRPPDQVVRYGDRDDQVADLRLPAPAGDGRGAGDARAARRGACPLVIFLHGGFWRAEFDRAHAGPLAQALASSGFAVCTPEYRRTGQAGGGWPGTFDDVAAAVDALPEIVAAAGGAAAAGGQADARRVVLAGHSAGGQLALWAAGRRRLPRSAPWYPARPPAGCTRWPAVGVVSLAGVCDLAACYRLKLGGGAAGDLMGGGPEKLPGRYLAADPMRLLPTGTRVRLVHGIDDDRVPPEHSSAYASRAQGGGDDVTCDLIPGCGHFEVIDPLSAVWPVVLAAFRSAAAVSGSGPGP